MILPTKHISSERALLTAGGHILTVLSQPQTVSSLWENFRSRDEEQKGDDFPKLNYQWFILAIDFLFMIGAIELKEGLLFRREP